MDHPTLFRVGFCEACGIGFPVGRTGRIARWCRPCAAEVQRAQARAWIKANYVPVNNVRTCVECSAEYEASGRDTKSLRCPPCREANKAEWKRQWVKSHPEKARRIKRKWLEANKHKVKAYKHRRRVLARDASADKFTALDIFERDNWTCQICGLHLDPGVKFPSNDSASIDHIIPISLGGTHTLDNVQAACMGCNRRKGARLAS